MAFDIDFKERGLIREHIRRFLLLPDHWNDRNNQYNFPARWKCLRFLPRNKTRLPDRKGVYCFIVKPKVPNFFETRYLFYVGQTTRPFRERFQEYLNDQEGKGKPRPKVYEMLSLYKGNLFFYYAPFNSNNRIDEVEEKLLNTFVPYINTKIPKARIKRELINIYG